jgi:hypothetical protein
MAKGLLQRNTSLKAESSDPVQLAFFIATTQQQNRRRN